LFIADTFNYRIRRVDARTGLITTVAGIGTPSYSGDGGAATAAGLGNAVDVAVDARGNLYIADYTNGVIRRVDAATGLINTVGGGLPATPACVAVDQAGNVYFGDHHTDRVFRLDGGGKLTAVAGNGAEGYSGDGVLATSTRLWDPSGLAVDRSGNLFIADTNNCRIRRVDAATGIITTAAGTGTPCIYAGDGGPATSAGLEGPQGVAVDAGGNLYIADTNVMRIRRVDARTGVITTIAGNGVFGYGGDGGPGVSASLAGPMGVAVDGAGNVLVADTQNQRIRRLTNPSQAAAVLVIVSGDGQSAPVNQAFAQPLVVQVNNSQGQPVAGASVVFSVTAGAARLTQATATTDAQGRASVTVTAGNTVGRVTITVSVGQISGTFQLTVRPPGPVLTAQSFVNAASFRPGVVPGGLVAISGAGLAPDVSGTVGVCDPARTTLTGPLPTQLANVEVRFGETAAPVACVANVLSGVEYVVVQAPFELGAPGAVTVTAKVGAASTAVANVAVLSVNPGIFESVGADGTRAVVLRPDGSYVSPQNPAQRGETVTLLATGLGPTLPRAATNTLGTGGQNVWFPVLAGLNGYGVRVASAKYAKNMIGVYEVAIEVPLDAATGPDRALDLGAIVAEAQPPVFSATSHIAIGEATTPRLVTSSLPQATARTPYSASLEATGGKQPYRWSISAGTLPTGLSLNSSTGVISGTPAAAGRSDFTVQVTDANNASATRALSITVVLPSFRGASITGLAATVSPLDQPTVEIVLTEAYPLAVTGRLELSLAADAVTPPAGDTDLAFISGGKTVDFSIPAGSTRATNRFQVGTVAGTITLRVTSLRAGGSDLALPVSRTVTINRAAPAIHSARIISVTSTGFQLEVVGYSTPRQITAVTFNFNASPGASLETTTLSLDNPGARFATWYQGAASARYGSQFTLSVPFQVQGSVNDIRSVVVRLSNSQGSAQGEASRP